MAAATGSADQQPTSGTASGAAGGSLTLNLSSNNPFRNRAVSPSLNSPGSPFDDPSPRPVSRNPFLDPALNGSIKSNNTPADKMAAAGAPAKQAEGKKSPTAEELFDSLTLDDKKPVPPPNGARPPPRRPPPPPGRENMPPPGARRGPPPNHRPTRSQEEAMRARRAQGGPRGPQDSSRSPQRVPRPRRNSESSAVSGDKPPMTEEEKKAREARRRERERRHREGRDKSSSGRPGRRLDIIDKLDATSIFGTGLFHHDGPFDALNPHRNRNGSRRAPMQAFPKDSLNNSIGGSGPLNARPDHATFLGNNDGDAFRDYGSTATPSSSVDPTRAPKEVGGVFDPLSRGILHGDETLGLGTSTFLEGTPATRTAIQKREEEEQAAVVENGLARKKSLAQRIRNINRPGPREGFQPSGRMTNPEGAYASRRSPPTSPPVGGGVHTSTSLGERNPFFDEFESGKGGEENISIRRTESNGNGAKSPSSPRRERTGPTLERRVTSEGAIAGEDDGAASKQGGGGLLARVKSLKGGARRKPPVPSTAPPSAPARGSDEID